MGSIRRLPVFAMVAGLLVGGAVGTSAVAQDATPDAECVATTPEENIALVEQLYEAMNTGDGDTIDAVLDDEVTHNLDRYGLPDDSTTNDDEVALSQAFLQFYPGSATVVDDIFATENRVVAMTTQTITEHTLTGESVVLDEVLEVKGITVFTIDCGEIVDMTGAVDELGLLIGLGVIADPLGGEATPAP